MSDMVYSQGGEQQVILEYFKDFKGNLLDIGANDGITFSNSRQLIINGWKGTLVEPSKAFDKLEQLYLESNQVYLINYAISTYDGEMDWFESADTLITSNNEAFTAKWNHPYVKTTKTCRTYNTLFEKNRFHFISIDAEAMDWEILQQIDLSDTKLLCIEHAHIPDGANKIKNYCIGMNEIYRNGENIILAR